MDDYSILPPVTEMDKSKRWYKRPWVWILLFLVVWFGVPFLLETIWGGQFKNTEELTKLNQTNSQSSSKIKDVVTSNNPSLGPITAPVVIVEFGDFQCPYCKQEAPELKKVLLKYPEAVRLIYRDFPLSELHPEAISAAEAASCAAIQGKFWSYHDALFSNQDALNTTIYDSIAQSLSLDLEKFKRCREGHLTLAKIQEDFAAGVAAGVEGTPTFFVNGHAVAGVLTLEVWDKIIVATMKEKFGN
jgi:protein-disulfide isomerase